MNSWSPAVPMLTTTVDEGCRCRSAPPGPAAVAGARAMPGEIGQESQGEAVADAAEADMDYPVDFARRGVALTGGTEIRKPGPAVSVNGGLGIGVPFPS